MGKKHFERRYGNVSVTELISRQAAIDALDMIGSVDTDADREYAREVFMSLPSAQPQRKKGKWIKHIDDLYPAESTIECSVCHNEQPLTIDDNYCPNCGADMRGEE